MLAHNESRLTDIQLQNMPRKSHNPFNIFKSFQDLSIAGNLLISTILKKVQKKSQKSQKSQNEGVLKM